MRFMGRAILLAISLNLLPVGSGIAQIEIEATVGALRATHVLPLPPSPLSTRAARSEPVHSVYGEVRLRKALSPRFSLLTQLQLAGEGSGGIRFTRNPFDRPGPEPAEWPEVTTVEAKLGPAVEFALTPVIGLVAGAYGTYRLYERVVPASASPYGKAKPADLRGAFGFRGHIGLWVAELMYERGFRDSEGDIEVVSPRGEKLYPRYFRTSLRLGLGYTLRGKKNNL